MLPCDRTYLINLPHRTDRLRIAKKQFEREGITDYTVFPAIDARRLKLKGTTEDNQGLIGCFLSHYFIIQMALINGWKKIAIFEDDLLLVPDFQKKFDAAMTQVPEKWQMLYLGYYERSGAAKIQVSENITIPKNTWGTHAYMLKGEGIKIMYDNLQTIRSHIDVQMSEYIVPKMYAYCVSPALVHQSSIKSDIK
jgi:GR25 family glycosyltransferase involved in LPS biosynthesis